MLPGTSRPTIPFSIRFGCSSHNFEVGNSSMLSEPDLGPIKDGMGRKHEKNKEMLEEAFYSADSDLSRAQETKEV